MKDGEQSQNDAEGNEITDLFLSRGTLLVVTTLIRVAAGRYECLENYLTKFLALTGKERKEANQTIALLKRMPEIDEIIKMIWLNRFESELNNALPDEII